jgi:signal transduction histidine kinase
VRKYKRGAAAAAAASASAAEADAAPDAEAAPAASAPAPAPGAPPAPGAAIPPGHAPAPAPAAALPPGHAPAPAANPPEATAAAPAAPPPATPPTAAPRVAAAAPASGEPEKLRAELAELQSAKQRLSKLYFSQVEESRKRTQRLQLLLEDICAIGAALDLDTVLARLAGTLCQRMGFSIVVVRVREPGTDRLAARAFAGVDETTRAAIEGEDLRLDQLMSQLHEESKVSRSYFIGQSRGGAPERAGGHEGAEWQPDDLLLVPTYGRTGELVACFSVEDPEDRLVPSLETIGLLEILGNLAGASIENAALYRQLDSHTRDLEVSGRRTQELHSLKNDFISTVSRELHTPLAAIRAHVETLLSAREEEIPFDLQRRFLSILHEESERLARLVESLLDLNRFDAGVAGSTRESVDVAAILDEVATLLAPAAEVAQVDLKAQIDAADTRMDADRDQIRQLVLHLGGNAVKFTPPGGRVTMRLFGDPRDMTLEVEDSGAGIPEPLIQRIFGRSAPVDSSMVRRFGGAGLGLAICRSIVEWHGGRVFAESAPGQGSRFTVVLPRRTGPRVILRPGVGTRGGTRDVLRMAVEMVAQVMNARVVSLLAPVGEGGDLVVHAALGLEERVVHEAAIKPGSGVAGWVAQRLRPVCVSDTSQKPESAGPGHDLYRTGTFLSVPLEGERGLLGVLNVTDPISGKPFDAEDCHLMLHLAERVSAALEEAERGTDAADDGPAPALRSAITDLGHGRESAPRSVRLGRATARALGLPESEVGLVSFAASAPGDWIAEAGERPAHETAAAGEAEPQAAAGPEGDAVRLSRVETMSAVREILLSRHEWWDGSGYPRGLEGASIPLGGRILAVVDAYERMTTGKGRRAALSREDSIRELQKLAGARFDPEVVEAFEGACAELGRSGGDATDSWEHASATQGGE